MSLFGKHRNNNKQLDALITSVKNNASNNYKLKLRSIKYRVAP